jgi:hypothetical protein
MQERLVERPSRPAKRSGDREGRDREERRKKRKSRWTDEACKTFIPGERCTVVYSRGAPTTTEVAFVGTMCICSVHISMPLHARSASLGETVGSN